MHVPCSRFDVVCGGTILGFGKGSSGDAIADREVVAEKFNQGISGENPYWEDNQAVPSLSDHCIKSIVRWLTQNFRIFFFC